MGRFDAAGLLAQRWGFREHRFQHRQMMWDGPGQGDEIRSHAAQVQQYLEVTHDGGRPVIAAPTIATAEELIALLDAVADAIGQGGQRRDLAASAQPCGTS